MKNLFILILLCLAISDSLSQSCLPEGIVFTRQSQIDSFPILYPNCIEVMGSVEINGTSSPIFILSGLANLKVIKGNLRILHCDSLATLHGLEQLHLIGQTLSIQDNVNLVSIAHFVNLDSIGWQIHITGNAVLESLLGLGKIRALRMINTIFNNASLENMMGLNQLKEVRGDLRIINNHRLENLYGLDSLKIIYGNLEVRGHNNLTSFSGLSNLREIGTDLDIQSNRTLFHLEGLSQLERISRTLQIANCPDLIDLVGMDKLNHIGLLSLSRNNELVNLHGLETLTTITTRVFIIECENLENVDALSNATGLTESIFIKDNAKLNNLQGLGNLCEDHLEFITLQDNPSLSDCAAHCICEHLFSGSTNNISGNLSGCNTREEIVEACLVGTEGTEKEREIILTPNPTQGLMEIIGLQTEDYSIRLINLMGKVVRKSVGSTPLLDLYDLEPGIYIVSIQRGNVLLNHRVIKY